MATEKTFKEKLDDFFKDFEKSFNEFILGLFRLIVFFLLVFLVMAKVYDYKISAIKVQAQRDANSFAANNPEALKVAGGIIGLTCNVSEIISAVESGVEIYNIYSQMSTEEISYSDDPYIIYSEGKKDHEDYATGQEINGYVEEIMKTVNHLQSAIDTFEPFNTASYVAINSMKATTRVIANGTKYEIHKMMQFIAYSDDTVDEDDYHDRYEEEEKEDHSKIFSAFGSSYNNWVAKESKKYQFLDATPVHAEATNIEDEFTLVSTDEVGDEEYENKDINYAREGLFYLYLSKQKQLDTDESFDMISNEALFFAVLYGVGGIVENMEDPSQVIRLPSVEVLFSELFWISLANNMPVEQILNYPQFIEFIKGIDKNYNSYENELDEIAIYRTLVELYDATIFVFTSLPKAQNTGIGFATYYSEFLSRPVLEKAFMQHPYYALMRTKGCLIGDTLTDGLEREIPEISLKVVRLVDKMEEVH